MTIEDEAWENIKWKESTEKSVLDLVRSGTLGEMADHPYALWFQGKYLPDNYRKFFELVIDFDQRYRNDENVRVAHGMRFAVYLDLWLYMPHSVHEQNPTIVEIMNHWSRRSPISHTVHIYVSHQYGPCTPPHWMLKYWEERIGKWHGYVFAG